MLLSQGVGHFYKARKKHIVTVQTVSFLESVLVYLHVPITYLPAQEHKCVLDSCRTMENEGFAVTYLPVQKNGVVDLKVCVK